MQGTERAQLDHDAAAKHRRLESSRLRKLYRVFAGVLHVGEIGQQRLKTFYFGWGYLPLLKVRGLPIGRRIKLIRDLLRVDWHVVHGHRPAEIAVVAKILSVRSGCEREVFVEAGCWRGGSSAKFSILCEMFGYRLQVFDSFEGVETLDESLYKSEWRFGGQYACAEDVVRSNVAKFGRPAVCEFHKGWFSETLARFPVTARVRLAYIDCDLAKGTLEALQGVMPSIATDGCILRQDFHIMPVRKLLLDPETWSRFGVETPRITIQSVYMAQFDWIGPPFTTTMHGKQ